MARRRRNLITPAETAVTNAMGRLGESWGVRRNLGRTWAVLYLQGRPLTAAELQKMLKLSTGAVSMTLRELQRWGVVRQVMKSGERRKLYVAEVDVWRVVSRVLRARELVELDDAVDRLEKALAELRSDMERDERKDPKDLEGKIRRVEGLLDLLRMISSMLRVLVTTARFDATVLASLRLGRGSDDQDR